VRFDEGVEDELLEAASYYDTLTPGAGGRFLLEVTCLIEQIEMFPQAGRSVRPGLRQRLVPTFPYILLYTTDAADPAVIAVAHTSRREHYWMGRWEIREPCVAYLQLAA
jgi:hypothetical protein